MFVRKKTYNELVEKLAKLEETHQLTVDDSIKKREIIRDQDDAVKANEAQHNKAHEALLCEIDELRNENIQLQAEVKVLQDVEASLTTNSEQAEIVLRFNDKLTSVTPICRWNPDVISKLQEQTMITPEAGDIEIQIALMYMGYEGLEHIVESMSPSVDTEK